MSGPATIWWVRHGPTGVRGMCGWSDVAARLDDAAALSRLSAALPPDAAVVSSDLDRARRTADAIAGPRRRLPDDPALREMHFGDWELRTAAEIEAADPETARAFWDDPASVTPPGGEHWDALSARVESAVVRLTEGGGDLVAVAHFGTILSQVQRARGTHGPDAFAQAVRPLSLTRIRIDGAARVVDCADLLP